MQFSDFKKFFSLPGDMNDKDREKSIKAKARAMKSAASLAKEQLRNEKAKLRCVALCLETRPDRCGEKGTSFHGFQRSESMKRHCWLLSPR